MQLAYDANGNLREKGDFRYAYDYRNRLTEVSLADGTVLATYGYDAFNRRVRQEHASTVTETVYSGWQEMEEYIGGQLHWRWSYGRSLDEVLRMEGDLDQDGSLETDYQPVFDSSGNLVQLTNGSGGLISKYFYSPFGEVMAAHIDNQAGQVDQLVWRAGSFHLEFSEAILTDPLFQVVEQGEAFLLEIANGIHHELVGLPGPTREGYGVERIVLTPETVPPPGVTVQLVIPVGAIEDHCNNVNTTAYEKTFTLPDPAGPDQILDDVAPPHVEAVYLDEGMLKITFSEQPDLVAATAAIQLNGNQATWTESPDQATLVLADPLPVGTHSLQITKGPLDLAGEGLEEGFTLEIAKGAATSSSHLFLRPNDREVPLTVLSNYLGYHGRKLDVETGLIYFRNRYYDPELGRFISADPLEYVDGPSQYIFAGNDPINMSDPLGLACPECTKLSVARANQDMARRHEERIQEIFQSSMALVNQVGSAVPRGDLELALSSHLLGYGLNPYQRAKVIASVLGSDGGSAHLAPFIGLGAIDEMVRLYWEMFATAPAFGEGWAAGRAGVRFVRVNGLRRTWEHLVARFGARAVKPRFAKLPRSAENGTGRHLYRGVSVDHPQLAYAERGIVMPADPKGVVSAAAHNYGGVSSKSPFTAWTRDPAVARYHALKAGEGGVVLRVPVGAPSSGDSWGWVWSPDAWGESEILLQGVREGVKVFLP